MLETPLLVILLLQVVAVDAKLIHLLHRCQLIYCISAIDVHCWCDCFSASTSDSMYSYFSSNLVGSIVSITVTMWLL
jgi:hypothetical protein